MLMIPINFPMHVLRVAWVPFKSIYKCFQKPLLEVRLLHAMALGKRIVVIVGLRFSRFRANSVLSYEDNMIHQERLIVKRHQGEC